MFRFDGDGSTAPALPHSPNTELCTLNQEPNVNKNGEVQKREV
jgi:hypothetical protein